MESGTITKHYLISGRVQGVGFRAFTRRLAAELGVKGWVRNLEDGRVEAVASAGPNAVADFEHGLRQGPAHGRVDSFMVSEHPDERWTGFEILD